MKRTIKSGLIAVGAVAAGLLVALTLGQSIGLIAVVIALFIPVLLAWLALCGKLEANEPALDAMLTERRDTLKATAQAMRGRTAQVARRLDEVK